MPRFRGVSGSWRVDGDTLIILGLLLITATPIAAAVGIVMAVKARGRLRAVEGRLAAAETALAALRSAAPPPAPPARDDAPHPAPEQDLAAPPPADEISRSATP